MHIDIEKQITSIHVQPQNANGTLSATPNLEELQHLSFHSLPLKIRYTSSSHIFETRNLS